jgi:PAS domain S-box-containing protein
MDINERLRREIQRREKAEEALKEAERKNRDLIRYAPAAISEFDFQTGRFTSVNDAMCKMLGYSRKELLEMSPLEFMPEESRALFRDRIAKWLSGSPPENQVEYRVQTKEGRFLDALMNMSLDLDQNGRPRSLMVFAHNITERKGSEEALRESEKQARRIAEEAMAMASIGRILSSTLTIEDVFTPFAEEVRKIIPFDRIVIDMIDGENGTVRNVYIAGRKIEDRETERIYRIEGSGNAEIFRTKSPFLLQTEDFTPYQDRFPMLRSTFDAGFRSILNVPLISHGKVIGGLLLRSLTPGAYTDDSVRLSEMVASQIAGAVANSELFLKQRRAEEALRESELRFRQVAESISDFVWEVDAEGLYLYTSPSVERILGYRPDELIGKMHFYDLFTPESREQLKWVTLTAFAEKKPFRGFPNLNVSKQGRKVEIETSGTPVLDSAGNLAGYRGADTDVTERNRAENALAESEIKYRNLYESMMDAYVRVDMVGRIREFNSTYQKMLGYSDEELKAKTYKDLTPKEWHEFESCIVEQVLQRGYSDVFEKEYRKKDGTVFPVELRTFLLRDSLNEPGGMWAIVRDVTERKRTEMALRESEERLRTLFEESAMAIGMSREGKIISANKKYIEMFGYESEQELHGQPIIDQWAPGSREEAGARNRRRELGLPVRPEYDGVGLRKDGSRFNMHVVMTQLNLRDGLTSIAFLTDTTERNRAEEELKRYQNRLEEMVRERTAELVMAMDRAEAANRAKSLFLANMSHELRTPLNSILGVAQMMDRDAGFPRAYRDPLNILSRSGTHLLELIDDVLEVSKIEAGQTALVETRFDLQRFLDDLEHMMGMRASRKALHLIFERDPGLPRHVETDERKLRQVLINLVGNAIKFTAKGQVSLKIRLKKGVDTAPCAEPAFPTRLVFEVEDTGIGIPLADSQKIFEPFVQLTPGLSSSDGTGLGLTLSRAFVTLMGGEITVCSQVGRGSTFAFDIPVKEVAGISNPVPKSDLQVIGLMPGQPSYRLLVADDSFENRFVLRGLLEQGGFTVLEASGGQEAVDLFKSGDPHLIWMDLRMPGIDGNEAARRIREAEKGMQKEEGKEIHTPIIALTAGALEDGASVLASGLFDDFLRKPFDAEEVYHNIGKHLGAQFAYHLSGFPEKGERKIEDTTRIAAADLSRLGADWLRLFFQDLRKGRSAQLLGLIDQIPPEHADLSRTLAELVRTHRFDTLIAATEEALKQGSDR